MNQFNEYSEDPGESSLTSSYKILQFITIWTFRKIILQQEILIFAQFKSEEGSKIEALLKTT